MWTVPLVPRRVTALRWFGTVMALLIGVALGDADLERPERPLPGRRHELAKHGHTSVRVRIVGNVRWKPPVDDDRGVDLTPTSASTTGGAGTLVRPVPRPTWSSSPSAARRATRSARGSAAATGFSS